MAAALQDVKDGMGVREASRLYNLPYETLRRRVAENVDLECRPGPPTVLTENEETELASYCVKMADMGFGLSRTDVMVVAFKIVEASGRKHPFTDGAAGRAWFDGFKSRHPRLTLRSTQSLSRARASSGNSEIISDFFAKLAALFNSSSSPTSPVNKPDASPDASWPDTSPDTSSVTKTSSVGRSHLSDHDSEYRKKYEEGCDVYTDDYLQWIRDNKLPLPTGDPLAHKPPLSAPSSSNCDESTASSLSEILALPKPIATREKTRKQAVNAKAYCITGTEVLEDLKRQKEEKAAKEREKEKRRQERERKKKEKQEEKERKKQEREKKKEDRQKKKDQKQPQRQTRSNSRKTCASVLVPELRQSFSELNIGSTDSGEESEAECPECGLVYGSAQDEEQWVQCDNCAAWWDMTCAGVDENIADSTFVCSNCM